MKQILRVALGGHKASHDNQKPLKRDQVCCLRSRPIFTQ